MKKTRFRKLGEKILDYLLKDIVISVLVTEIIVMGIIIALFGSKSRKILEILHLDFIKF